MPLFMNAMNNDDVFFVMMLIQWQFCSLIYNDSYVLIKVIVHFKSKTVSRELPKDQSGLGIALCLKRPASAISAAAFKSKSLRNSLIHRICLQINKECRKLEKKSLLKKTAVRDLKHFQWNAVLKEWMKEY